MPAGGSDPMKKGTRKKRVIIALCVALGLMLLGTGLLVAMGLHDEIGHADAALVLGSKVELNGEPSARLRARLDRTLELYRAGYFPKIITSGGIGEEGFDEAAVMRDYLVARGVPREDVLVDSGGNTTFDSARNTLQLARQHKFSSVLVVSQYFHVPRARLALRRFGITTVFSAHAHFYEWRDIYSSFRELFAWLSYFFRNYDSAAA
jgi:vancomycin permeability regulator SanA